MIKTYKPTSYGQRTRKTLIRKVDNVRPLKSRTVSNVGTAGRTHGTITSRHKERGSKKLYRQIDFRREKYGIPATVQTIEYDPNRGPHIALIAYRDGEKRYILAPEGLEKGMTITSGKGLEPTVGNAMPLGEIPLGSEVHNIEINPGSGGSMVKGAGGYGILQAKDGNYVNIKLPSGEVKKVRNDCYATVGVLSNADKKNTRLGKAGKNRYLGNRPHVRGVAMGDPSGDHPHAGKYRTSGIGMPSPKSPWGWKTLGVKTRKRRNTDYTIVKRRAKKKK
jgi:large subunit ribosomal protein L2